MSYISTIATYFSPVTTYTYCHFLGLLTQHFSPNKSFGKLYGSHSLSPFASMVGKVIVRHWKRQSINKENLVDVTPM